MDSTRCFAARIPSDQMIGDGKVAKMFESPQELEDISAKGCIIGFGGGIDAAPVFAFVRLRSLS
jgi:hypothetical protein